MKRVQKNMLTAAVLLAAGVGFGLYTLKTKVRTPEERFLEDRESKRLFRFGRIDVVRGTLKAKSATIAFEREDDGGWRLTEPVNWPADDEAIDAALDRMAAIIMEPVTVEDATDADRAREGLVRPHVSLHVVLKGDIEHTLNVGRRNKLEDKYPITDAAKSRIGLSDSAFYWAMDRTFDELRSKRLVDLVEDDVVRMSVFDGDGALHYRLEKDGEGWTTEGADQPKIVADSGDVLLARVRLVRRLSAASFATDDYDPSNAEQKKKLGFDAPKFRIEIEAKDGAKVGLVMTEDPKREGQYLMHVEGTGTVAEVAGSLVELLEKSAVQFRDRTFYKVDKKDIASVRFELGASKFEATRTGDSEWTVDGQPAKIWKLDAILRTFTYLKVDAIHAKSASKAEKTEWLLDPPSRKLILKDAEGQVLASVRIGKYARDELLFVQVDGDDRVGLLGDKKVDLLPGGKSELVDEER